MNIHSLETKIHQMVDDLQGLCSTVGLSNTANEEVVVTSVFLYKFLNDKFMYSLEEFSKEIDVPVADILKNNDGMLDAFYQYNSKNVAFAYEDTIQYLINHIEQLDFYKQFDEALVRISKYPSNDAFTVETADGEKTALFEPLTEKVEGRQRNNFAKAIFGIIAQDKFDFSEAFSGGFDFYSSIFEYLIKNYNVASGTYAEYFTPQTVSRIMAKILVGMSDKIEAAEIYDGAAGSGSLILHLAHELGYEGDLERAIVYTQDISTKSTRFLRLNMMLNGFSNSLGNIVRGDTLESPAHFNTPHEPDSGLKRFDYITTNPPFGIPNYNIDTRNRIEETWCDTIRFAQGVPNVPDKGKFQIYLLFIQHVLYSLKENGKAAIVVPTGFLTAKKSIEAAIRQKMVNEKILVGVVEMPSNIFANTGTNVSVVFVDKANKRDDVVLIDASKLGETIKEGKNKKTVLRDNEVDCIINTFINRKEVQDFSVLVSYEDLKEKNYSFSAGQYYPVVIDCISYSKDVYDEKLDYSATQLNTILREEASIGKQLSELFAKMQLLEGGIQRKRVVYLKTIASLVTKSISPQKDVLYKHYSIPAFDDTKCPLVEDGGVIESNKYVVPKNAILVSKLNPQFQRIWAPIDYDEDCICSTEFMPLVPNDSISKGLLYYVLMSKAFQQYMIQCSSSSTGSRKRMPPELIGEFSFELPDDKDALDVYSRIGELLIDLEHISIKKMVFVKETQSFLLPMLMNGQVKVGKVGA